jgi:predicted DNA-binding transcriptional regulator AlpA
MPEAHADVALCEMKDLVAMVRMSKAWISNEVAAQRFPQPAIKRPRCTRWKVSDVRKWLVEWTAQPATQGGSSGDLDNGFGGQGPPHEAAGARAEEAGDTTAVKRASYKCVAAEDSEGGI